MAIHPPAGQFPLYSSFTVLVFPRSCPVSVSYTHLLTEAHSEEEIHRALQAGARIIGINNRNLATFQVDFENSMRLRNLVPEDVLFVAESGIRTREDVMRLEQIGVDGVLIGETLMRAPDKKAMLEALKGR